MFSVDLDNVYGVIILATRCVGSMANGALQILKDLLPNEVQQDRFLQGEGLGQMVRHVDLRN